MTTTLKKGKDQEWALSLNDEKGLLLGVHFSEKRKISKVETNIVSEALIEAAKKIDALKPKSGKNTTGN